MSLSECYTPMAKDREAGLSGEADHGADEEESIGGQINVAPTRRGAVWKVISAAVRCPVCQSTESKALSGKRVNAQGMTEHYRECEACHVRFRLVLE